MRSDWAAFRSGAMPLTLGTGLLEPSSFAYSAISRLIGMGWFFLTDERMKKSVEISNDRSEVRRRDLLLGTAAALLLSSREAGAQATVSSRDAQTGLVQSGGTVMPVPANPSLGKGKDRALVLGGGGGVFHCLAARLCSRP